MFIRFAPLFLFISLLLGCEARLNVSNAENAIARADAQRHIALINTRKAGYSVFPDTDDPKKLEDSTFLEAMRVERPFGSSFAVRADGLVLTNAHVIEGSKYCTGMGAQMQMGGPPLTPEDILREQGRQNEETMREGEKSPTYCLLVAQDFSRVFRAKVVKINKKHDIAAMCLEDASKNVAHMEIESPQNIREGAEVITVGSPLGNTNMMTHGYISNTDFTAFDKETGKKAERRVQFSAAILPGNSGGPLVSVASGKIVGQVVAAVLFGGTLPTGMSYAIPVEDILEAMRDIPSCSKK